MFVILQEKRKEWDKQVIGEVERGFLDIIGTDECTVQLETHRRFCCRKKGEAPKNKYR